MEKIKILLIEDDIDDIELFTEALRSNNVDCEIDVVTEGDKALPHLASRSLPDVIVMDFNLPKLHGREILSELQASPYADIPVMVLTTSSSQDDMKFAYSMGVDKFITKPNSLQGFDSTVEEILSLTRMN
jgi:CheY-like chemotaxis protein